MAAVRAFILAWGSLGPSRPAAAEAEVTPSAETARARPGDALAPRCGAAATSGDNACVSPEPCTRAVAFKGLQRHWIQVKNRTNNPVCRHLCSRPQRHDSASRFLRGSDAAATHQWCGPLGCISRRLSRASIAARYPSFSPRPPRIVAARGPEVDKSHCKDAELV